MILDIKNLKKSFIDGKKTLNVLKNINLSVKKGSIVTIKGPSGSGKSTLLSLIGSLDRPDEGEVIFNNENIDAINDINNFRNEKIGFIFQSHNLISELSLQENVLLPREISGKEVNHQEINCLLYTSPSPRD